MLCSDDIDEVKLAEAALAILSLSAFSKPFGTRVWKGMDWELLKVLYENGWISDPVGKQKSVGLTDEGEKPASQFLKKHFQKSPSDG